MKKLMISFSLLFSFSILAEAQVENSINASCIPVPWVITEILDDGLRVSWGWPSDTTGFIKFTLATIDSFDPCINEFPWDGNLNVLGSTSVTEYICYEPDYPSAFAVRVNYDTCNSPFVSSDIISDDDYLIPYNLIVNLSLEDGGDPEGAAIMVDGNNCFYQDTNYYQYVGPNGQAIFDTILRGLYDITIGLPGYQTTIIEHIYLQTDTIIDVELSLGGGTPPIDFEVDTISSTGSWGLPKLKNSNNKPLAFRIFLNELLITELPGDQYNYTFESLEAGVEYEAEVRAVYDWGESLPATFNWTSGITTVNENLYSQSFSIFPNPANEIISVQFDEEIEWLQMVNSTGRKILDQEINASQTQIKTSGFEPGIYVIGIKTANQVIYRKVIIQ